MRATEKADLSVSGYGVKAFTLSMVRAAITVTDGAVPVQVIAELVDLGRSMLTEPVQSARRCARGADRGVARHAGSC